MTDPITLIRRSLPRDQIWVESQNRIHDGLYSVGHRKNMQTGRLHRELQQIVVSVATNFGITDEPLVEASDYAAQVASGLRARDSRGRYRTDRHVLRKLDSDLGPPGQTFAAWSFRDLGLILRITLSVACSAPCFWP